jgi:hypothetical protein
MKEEDNGKQKEDREVEKGVDILLYFVKPPSWPSRVEFGHSVLPGTMEFIMTPLAEGAGHFAASAAQSPSL